MFENYKLIFKNSYQLRNAFVYIAKRAHWSAGVSTLTQPGDWPSGFWYLLVVHVVLLKTQQKPREINYGICAPVKNPLGQPWGLANDLMLLEYKKSLIYLVVATDIC